MAAKRKQPERRQSFFGQQVIRLMTKTCLANDLGHAAFTLLAVISAQQDAARGRPVTYWNQQLMSVTALRDERTLRKVRQACIASGWLTYQYRGKRKAGMYQVIIPARFADLNDSRCDEGSPAALGASDARTHVPNHARNGAPNDVPNHAPNHAPPPSSPSITSPSLCEGERERLILLVSKQKVHQAETAVDAAIARGCSRQQIEEAVRVADGKALLTALTHLKPAPLVTKGRRAKESAEDKRLRIIAEHRAAGIDRDETNRQLLAAGLDGIAVPEVAR